MRLPRVLLLAAVAIPVFALVATGHVAAFCEILEPPTPIPTQVNGTAVEIQLAEGFARVVIIKEFYNPSDVFKEGQIFFPLEKGHELITDLSLKIGNVVYNSTARDRGGALDDFLTDLANGKDAALVQYDPPRDVYWIAVTIPPRESRTTITTLEMPLTKRDGFYEYDYRLSVDAGHSVSYLRVHVRVETSAPLGDVQIPSHPGLEVLRRGTRVAESFINSTAEAQGRDLLLRFRADGPSVAQYADAATGDRYVRFSVDSGDPMFAASLRPLPRSFLLLVDGSGSMGLDGRWPLASAAALRLAQDLGPGETFAAAVYQGKRVMTFADTLVEANPSVLANLDTFLNSVPPGGSTAFTVALPWIHRWAQEARHRGQQAILFLLTDGRPTVGDAGLGLENAYKRISYDNLLPVFALAVKPRVHSDENLLRNVSHFNGGDLIALIGSDPADPVSEVLGAIRVPVLQGLRAEFSGTAEAAFASDNPQGVMQGGEALALAKVRGTAADPIGFRVSWADRDAHARVFERVYSGPDIPVDPLLKKQWVLARIHGLLESIRAHADSTAIEAVKDLATANRVVTPYTSLLVSIPIRTDADVRVDSGSSSSDFLSSATIGASAPAGPFSRAFAPPLVGIAADAEAFWSELRNPLLADHEVDRTVREGSLEHRSLGAEAGTVRFQGRFVTIVEVNGELVAIVRDWLDPTYPALYGLWTVVWIAAAVLTVLAIVRIRQGRLRGRFDAEGRQARRAGAATDQDDSQLTGIADVDENRHRHRI